MSVVPFKGLMTIRGVICLMAEPVKSARRGPYIDILSMSISKDYEGSSKTNSSLDGHGYLITTGY